MNLSESVSKSIDEAIDIIKDKYQINISHIRYKIE